MKPNIICKFIKTNSIEDYKKKKDLNKEIVKVSKLCLKNNPKNKNYLNSINFDFSIIKIDKENEIIKMDIPLNYFEDYSCSLPIMFIGDNRGNVRLFRFSYECLKKIYKKDGHKNNKYNQIIINNEKYNVEIRNDSKYRKNEGTFINKNIFTIKNKEKKNNYDIEEMNDLLFMKDFNKSLSYVISCYSNGVIKLWTL